MITLPHALTSLWAPAVTHVQSVAVAGGGVTGGQVVFAIFAVLAIFSALATVTRRNPVVAAVWLVACFFCVAACYVLLSATFLAALQVLVYAGAMMVLFVFVIMVLDVDERGEEEFSKPSRIGKLGYYSLLGLGGSFIVWVLLGLLARQYQVPGPDLKNAEFGTVKHVGRALFKQDLFAFEAISLLLVAAVVGAVVVARSRRDREKHAEAAGFSDHERQVAGLGQRDDAEVTEAQRRQPHPHSDFGAPSASGHDGGT